MTSHGAVSQQVLQLCFTPLGGIRVRSPEAARRFAAGDHAGAAERLEAEGVEPEAAAACWLLAGEGTRALRALAGRAPHPPGVAWLRACALVHLSRYSEAAETLRELPADRVAPEQREAVGRLCRHLGRPEPDWASAVPPSADLERYFALPEHLDESSGSAEVARLVAAGRHARAALAARRLRPAPAQRGRMAIAEAVCCLRAGEPAAALAVLQSGRRTIQKVWLEACALVRLGRLPEASHRLLWIGDRVPVLGEWREAAHALFDELRHGPPPWLTEPHPETAPSLSNASPPAPLHLAGFFRPARPLIPEQLEAAGLAVQRGRYLEAHRMLLEAPAGDGRRRSQQVVAAAQCLLLANRPADAEALLFRSRTTRGRWSLACAQVHQNRLEAALGTLARLARRQALDDEAADAAAALVAHLHPGLPPLGLEGLAGHLLLDPARARREGNDRYLEETVRAIERENDDRPAVNALVERVVRSCLDLGEEEARDVLVPVYEAAVRTTGDAGLARRGHLLLLSQPMAGDREASRALLFAAVSGQLDDLHRRSSDLAERSHSPSEGFSHRLAATKVSLVRDDLSGALRDARAAVAAAPSAEMRARATRLLRAAGWLVPRDARPISQWVLRPLHPLLPLAVAEALEDSPRTLAGRLAAIAQRAPAAAPHVAAADAHLAEARRRAGDGRLPIGRWAGEVGSALLQGAEEDLADALAFTGAACRLLAPRCPAATFAAHARALGRSARCLGAPPEVMAHAHRDPVVAARWPSGELPRAFAAELLRAWRLAAAGQVGRSSPLPDLARLLAPVAAWPPPPRLDRVPGLAALGGAPAEVSDALLGCIRDRSSLLPLAAPFRGPRWFESRSTYQSYQRGRELKDPEAALRSFEQAWAEEPHNRVTRQGLVFGLAGWTAVEPARAHLLEYLARALDRTPEREPEAALAYTRLAGLAASADDRRRCLRRAAALLRRRYGREPWFRARNAEIAIQLELGDLVEAGEAAWQEAQVHLPGSEQSRRYAGLAVTLWRGPAAGGDISAEHVRRALRLSRRPLLTDREAIQYAVLKGHLVLLYATRRSTPAAWRSSGEPAGATRTTSAGSWRSEAATSIHGPSTCTSWPPSWRITTPPPRPASASAFWAASPRRWPPRPAGSAWRAPSC